MKPLRVVGGSARGRNLRSVPGNATRPITDRAKESLFNILRPDLQDAAFLDLFAGTGAVGIEALSQGAGFARFVDNQRDAIKTIRENLELTKFSDLGEVLQADAFAHVNAPANKQFDYVFIAPPQFHGLWKRALESVDSRIEWLVDDAWVIVQVDPTEYEKVELKNLKEFDKRKYGNVVLVFYQRA
jgi:16S rRNA (guanine(966)-N(2))-methyltransferase RsmD